MTMHQYFLRKAIAYAAAKPAPDRIPLSRPGVLERDYFLAYLEVPGSPLKVLVTGVSDVAVQGTAWDADVERFCLPVSIPWDAALEARISLTTYYRQSEFHTDNPNRFVLQQWTRIPMFAVLLDRTLQWAFNRWPLKRHSRMSMLRLLVDRTSGSGRGPQSEITLTAMRANRAVFHPDWKRRLDHNRLLLDALVAEKLAEHKDNAYRSSPLAIGALEKEKRERRAQRWKWLAGIVAAVWAVVGFVVPNWTAIHSWLPSVGGISSAPSADVPSPPPRVPR